MLEKITLSAPDGAAAEIYLQGAHITSWVPAGGSERLFLSAASEFRPGAPIRGGVPVIFPQFGSFGSLPKHGFARNIPWDLEGIYPQADSVTARLTLRDNELTRQAWDYPFTLSLTIEIGGPRLALRLAVTNPGETPFTFTGALHTYLRVDEIAFTTLSGLGGRSFIDTVGGTYRTDRQADDLLRINGEIDRIYPNAPSPLRVQELAHKAEVTSRGFSDCVIWNPGAQLGAKLADLEPEGFRRFLCVESAQCVEAVTLRARRTWEGEQIVVV